eukprot:2201132-Pyramimonas_sp.AAC.1
MNAAQQLYALFCILLGAVVYEDILAHDDTRARIRAHQAYSFLVMCLLVRPATQFDMFKNYGGRILLGLLALELVGDYLPI